MSIKPSAFIPQDLVLIHLENKPAFFARVEDINPDIKRGWWQVKLFILTIPMKVVTWIIDEDQIRGADFTMGGVPVRIEKVTPPREAQSADTDADQSTSPAGQEQSGQRQARILSFNKRSGN